MVVLMIPQAEAAMAYKQAKLNYHSYIQQITKIKWMKYGDENLTVFHQSLRRKRVQNNIQVL